MQDKGKVIELIGSDAVVEFEANSACAKCGACLNAGHGMMRALVKNPLNAKVGDSVEVEILPVFVIGASFLIFIFPLLFLIAGYFLGYYLFPLFLKEVSSQNAGIIISFLFFFVSWFFIRFIDINAKKQGKFTRKIVKIVK